MNHDRRRAVRARFLITCIGPVWLLAWAGAAMGQCELTWQPGDGVRGVEGASWSAEVSELFVWDPDGPGGPKASVLVLANRFDLAGQTNCRNIALYDGVSFHPLGSGIEGIDPGSTSISALGEYNGDLIAGGMFTIAGGKPASGIARWDGVEWHALGEGIIEHHSGKVFAGVVHDVTNWNGQLIAVGSFDVAGGNLASNVAGWNGTTWNDIGGGVSLYYAEAAASYQGELYVAGSFLAAGDVPAYGIARWNGSRWDDVNGGLKSAQGIRDLDVHDGLLYAAGSFKTIGGVSTGALAAWDGNAWQQPTAKKLLEGALSLTFQESGPVVTTAGGQSDILGWDGTNWTSLAKNEAGQTVIEAYAGELYYAGTFRWVDESVGVNNIARRRDGAWEPLVSSGFELPAYVSLAREDGLYVGGGMRAAGDQAVQGVARWDGKSWSAVGSGLLDNDGYVAELADYKGELHAAGSFRDVPTGPVAINGIARWDGQAWRNLGTGLTGWTPAQPAGAAMVVFADSLYVGGSFLKAGDVSVLNIARWDGSQWHDVAGGVSGVPQYSPLVRDLLVFQDQVIVSGSFQQAGSIRASNIASWDGTQWSGLGTGLSGSAGSMVEHDGALFVATNLGSPAWTDAIVRWDGAAWTTIIEDESVSYESLGVHQGKLIVGGAFDSIGGVPAMNIAQWDGATWSPVAGGLDGTPFHLLSRGNELIATGNFLRAGGKTSAYFARLACDCQADCDRSGSLNIDDFVCFQTLFAMGEPGADCDGSGQLDIDDFVCFQTLFATGC